jgi:dTDP-4-amino-4,6-dideoxygalactose transaminase
MIRLASPSLDDRDIAEVAAVLRSGFLVQGEHVAAFESAVAARVGTAHAVAVSSGTAALHLALLSLDIGSGDEVAVPCYSWPATANVVVRVGASPVFIDIDPATQNIDITSLERAALAHPRLRAVMPVHAFGSMADMPAISRFAKERGLEVIEDAACALGAILCGRSAGAWARAGCFSFHPRKVVTTGEGGMVTTDDPALNARLRELRNHGLGAGTTPGEFIDAGLNYRLTDFQGALGHSQLTRLDAFLERRRDIAHRYAILLRGLDLQLPAPAEERATTFQSYVVLLPRALAARRAALIAHLRKMGVEVAIGTHHIPLTSYFRRRDGYRPGDFPATDDVAARALALPMYHALTEEDQHGVVEALGHAMIELSAERSP